ncbi:hypothetical protein K461DRAFT_293852 [Myriangium duriaei CBS 260.36]|uniref:Rhodopsin domain-containing protein n=1 Tax=Myriangium duriaei CBS 260.36 TaxID=1168546 RepID=A0A9P4MHX3_9PEZI|nr:hypothetical protein K461DRAFT_293852 [Myriangium duriaei CBS 260.36]
MADSTTSSAYGGSGPFVMGISWAQAAVGTLLVILRAFAARTHSGSLRWDFLLIAAAMPASLISQVLLTLACLHGAGNHLANIHRLDDLWDSIEYTMLGLTVGTFAITLAKLSIVALLLQVTPVTAPKDRSLLWFVGIFVTLVNIAESLTTLTQCSPMSRLWYRLEAGACPRTGIATRFSYFQGAIAVFADLFLAVYPTTIVWSLQLSTRTKIGFCVLMAGGFLPAVAGIMRCLYTQRLNSTADITSELRPFITWAITELWFVIILGSIPPLRPLFERVILGRTTQHKSKGTSGSFPQASGTLNKREGGSKNIQTTIVAVNNA